MSLKTIICFFYKVDVKKSQLKNISSKTLIFMFKKYSIFINLINIQTLLQIINNLMMNSNSVPLNPCKIEINTLNMFADLLKLKEYV